MLHTLVEILETVNPWSRFSRRRSAHKNMPKEAKASSVFPIQRCLGVRFDHHCKKEVQQTAYDTIRGSDT